MDFDDAKENIQPLASGRNVEILETALNAESQHEVHEKLLEQRKEYERIINEYVGDDPLEPWYNYIQWVEQSYPKSGKETALDQLLAKCLSAFENDERYTQDSRLIKLYIKYIDSEPNPHEFYELLYNKGIGTMVADLYLCWAHYYDYCDNFEKAESVYQKGLDARAQPIEQLEHAHRQFGFSMSQRLLHKDPATRQKFLTSMDEQRIALTSLRAHKHRVGSIRTGSAIKSYNPGKLEQQQSAAGNSSNRTVPVFHDENVSMNASVQNQTAVAPTPVRQSVVQTILSSTKKQENLREPGPWTKAKMKNSKPVIASCSQKLAFSIMADDDLIPLPESENMYARGIQLPSNFVRKNLAQTDFRDIPLHRDTEISVNSLPGYDKIFLFPNEKQSFSMEELQAYKYFKKRGIVNNFIDEQDKIWECGYDVPIRLSPAFARSNDKQYEQLLLSEFNPYEDPGPKRKYGFNINELYSGNDDENSLEEILRTRWIMGELRSQKANDMEMTCAFNRRESIFSSAVERRRSIVMGRGALVVPDSAEATRRSILSRKSILTTPRIAEFEMEKTSADEIKSTEQPVNELNQKDVLPKRKSLDQGERIPDFQSPPVTRRKLTENADSEQPPKSKFSIFEDKVDRDVFKTPHLPPVAKPRPSVVFQDEDDEPCTTQTFNFYIKAQSISTPKATKKPSLLTITDDDYSRAPKRDIIPANENLSPINSSPEENEKPKQPFALRTIEKEVGETNFASPQEPFELVRQKLSAIMETTEDANTISSTTIISSKSSSSSEESDCSKRTPLAIPSLRTIPETTNLIRPDGNSSNLIQSNVDNCYLPKVDDATSSMTPFNTIAEKSKTPSKDLFTKPAEVNSIFLKKNAEKTLPFMPSSTEEIEDKTEDLLKFFDKNQTTNKSMFSVFCDETLPSVCPLNIEKEKTDTVPKPFEKNQSKLEPDTSVMASNKLLDKAMSTLENLEGKISDEVKMNNKSAFTVFRDETMPSMCPVNIVEDKTDTAPKIFGSSNQSKLVTEISEINLNRKTSDKPNCNSVFSIFQDDTLPSMCPVNIVEDKTDTIPKTFGKNQSKLLAEHSIMTTTHKPLDEMPLSMDDDGNQTTNKSVFTISQDETVPSMCPLNIVEEKTDTVPKMFKKDQFRLIAETSIVTAHKPLNRTMPLLDDVERKIDDGTINTDQNAEQRAQISDLRTFNPIDGSRTDNSVFCIEEEEESAAFLFSAAHSDIRTINASCRNIEANSNDKAGKINSSQKSNTVIHEDVFAIEEHNIPAAVPTKNETSTTKYDDEFYSLLESPVKISNSRSSVFKNPLPVKDLPACFKEKIRLSTSSNQSKFEVSQTNRSSTQLSNNKSIFEMRSNLVKRKESTEQLSETSNDTELMLPPLKPIEPSLLLEPMKDPSMSLLEPMKEVSLTERIRKEVVNNNHTSEGEKEQQFLFSDEIPNTAQFSLNITSIKNSTVISEYPNINHCTAAIKEESVHIKEEPLSKVSTMELPSFLIPSESSPFESIPAIVAGSACTLTQPFQRSILDKPSLSPQPEFNITGINLNQIELRALMESEDVSEENRVRDGIQIIEPRTIRPSTFQYTIRPSFNPLEMTFKDSSLTDSPEHLNNIEDKGTVLSSCRKSAPHQLKDVDQSCVIVETSSADTATRDEINPFDIGVQNAFLDHVDFVDYIRQMQQCTFVNRVKPLEVDKEISISERDFYITKLIGQGSYGFVYSGRCIKTNEMFAFKQERPPNLWEFYIALEIHSRIENHNVLPGLMSIDYALVGQNSSVFVTKYCEYGSLLDICNKHKSASLRNLDESIVMIFANQMLSIVDHLHGANIIHGDIKPDNFLLMKKLNYGNNEIVLKLIDYGQSIDMNFFERQTFTAKLDTKNFVCTEMLENKPWTFQLDLFCLASTIYTILCGKYMNVKKQSLGLWAYTIADELPPNLDRLLWTNLLHTLINVRDCNSMPNLQNLRLTLKEAILVKERFLEEKIRQFNLLIGN